jgi:NAD+ synthase (glutamine-hydrolysing)
MSQLRIVAAQLNFWTGDIHGNTQKIIHASKQARDQLHADVIVFPELALCGYPPEDLLLRPDFHTQIEGALLEIQQKIHGIDMVIGHPHRTPTGLYNAASVIRNGERLFIYHKQCLPNYGVFDEKRYFIPGSAACIFSVKNIPIAVTICEDIWHPAPVAQAQSAGAELIVCLNASPMDIKKSDRRENILRTRIRETGLPIIYVHGVGGQDDLIFDGGSMALDEQGKICAHAGFYEEKLLPITIETNHRLVMHPQLVPPALSIEATAYRGLVLAVRDYIYKNGFKGALIGLSGGIDSALTLTIAIDAIGKENVHAVLMPSRYTSEISIQAAKEQVEKQGVISHYISIEPIFQAFLNSLSADFSGLPIDQTEENLQARCRGTLLMALSNKTGRLVLTTGNKSEMAVGYATLYGDMAGGFAVLKDVPKTLVYRLAHYRNQLSAVIPQIVIERPPTAELALQQKDEDSLPPYAILDPILEMYVEQDKSPAEIIAAGFTKETVYGVIAMVDRNEYKRRQAAPGPRITTRAFTRERRYPITSKYRVE